MRERSEQENSVEEVRGVGWSTGDDGPQGKVAPRILAWIEAVQGWCGSLDHWNEARRPHLLGASG